MEHADYCEVQLSCQGPAAGHWVEEGWHRDSEATWMCTLTRRLPKKAAPVNAAGLGSASESAKARWEADNFAFQVYQYEDRFLLCNSVGDWRVPSVLERETLGFDSGYTAAALPTKPSKEEAMTIRCSVLGSNFQA